MRYFIITASALGLGLFFTWMCAPGQVHAHVEKSGMPDPVAEMEYRILLEFKPDDLATRNLLAMALLRQKKMAEAEKEFREIIRRDPNNFDAMDGLALLLMAAGGKDRDSEALKLLQAAAALRPDDILVHLHLGKALAAVGQLEAARLTLQRGLDLVDTRKSFPDMEKQKSELTAALRSLPNPSRADSGN